jgi:hypothetical protein
VAKGKAPPALRKRENEQIQNNMTSFLGSSAAKAKRWATIDKAKKKAANILFEQYKVDSPNGLKQPKVTAITEPETSTENPGATHAGSDAQPQDPGTDVTTTTIPGILSTPTDNEGGASETTEVSNEETVPDDANKTDLASRISTDLQSGEYRDAASQASKEVDQTVIIAQSSASGQGPAASAASNFNLRDAPVIDFGEVARFNPASRASDPKDGNSVPVDSKLAEKLSHLKDTSKYPLKTLLRMGRKWDTVITNDFQMTIDSNATFYEYRITGIPAFES